MLRRTCTSLALALAAGAALAVPATPAVADDVTRPIQPREFFSGLVNGTAEKATIRVSCWGTNAAVGHPLPGQYVSVVPEPRNGTNGTVGYTGSAGTSALVDFGVPAYSNQPLILKSYYTSAEIPTGIDLPCSGTGKVTFVPRPESPDAVPAVVVVTYVSSAV